MSNRGHQEPGNESLFPVAKIGVIMFPYIAHRGMAITYMDRSRRSQRSFCNTMTAGHNNVIIPQVEAFYCQRKYRQKRAVAFPGKRYFLKKRCVYLSILDYL